ncbi:hypothetical protein FIBSPDRAFT_964279 [Athelia psychrophila]|uniref:Uncharacterized protein n=1 Tax=Athelia psychrophila TaxID=1759441 RepID=A0A165XYC9_9AGAM|nr:hypothetical protein FIBSPDRAFT_964279 [Fibularhizoctonia sp. CBS 109695]
MSTAYNPPQWPREPKSMVECGPPRASAAVQDGRAQRDSKLAHLDASAFAALFRGPQEPAAAGPRWNNFWSLGNLRLFGRAHDPEHAVDDDERHGAFDDRMLLELLAGEWDDMAMARHSAERPLFMSAHHPGRRVRHFEPE